MKKKLIAMLLTAVLVLSLMSISVLAEAPEVQIAAGTVRGTAVAGTELQIPVSITQNPGLVIGRVNVEWNHEVLSLESITYGTGLGQNNDSPEIENDGSYLVSFGDYTPGEDPGSDWTEVGELFILNFKVLDGAQAGTYNIALSGKQDDFLNNEVQEKTVGFTNGSVELYQEINTVPLEITAPVKGETPKDTIEATDAYSGSITWDPAVEGTFAANTVYTATVVLTANDGYEFKADASVTVNEETVEAQVGTDGRMTVTYEFPATDNDEIGSAVLEIPAPETHRQPIYNLEGKGFTGVISWSDELDAQGRFMIDTAYTATVVLTPEEGYQFADGFTATVNGETVEFAVNDDGTATGRITFDVTVEPVNSHLQWIEDESIELYADTNLWKLLKPEHTYHNGTIWRDNYKDIWSVTIPVKPGDKIYANSFESTSTNGGTSNGIAVAFFYGEDVKSSLLPADTYTQYKENGFITVPEGANAVCIPVWKNNENATVNLLSLPERIPSAELNVDAPVAGNVPVTEITDTAYTGTISWSPAVEGTFAAETVYTATITLTANEGYKFPADATATVNGADATAERDADGNLIVTYEFTATGKNEIPSVELTIEVPVKDAVPQTTIDDGEGYTGTITWDPAVEGTFAADEVYTATVVLTPVDGYVFAEDITATVNEKTATSVSIGDDGKLTVTYKFPSTKPKEAQTITCENVTATYGDEAMVLEAVASDNGEITYAVAEGEDVISITDSKVTFLKAGTAKITVYAAETEEYAQAEMTIDVTVSAADYTYEMTALTQYVKVGSELAKITVAPTAGTGVNGEEVEGTVAWYTDEDCTLAATADAFANTGEVTLYGAFTATNTNYVETEKVTAVTFTVLANGDVNADGKVSSADAMIFFRYLANWKGYEERILCMDAADVDNNGTANLEDATYLARYLAGWNNYEI